MVPVVAVALTQMAIIATSVYLHRTLAHRALAVHPVVELVFRTVLWLTTGQRRQQWVAVHRNTTRSPTAKEIPTAHGAKLGTWKPSGSSPRTSSRIDWSAPSSRGGGSVWAWESRCSASCSVSGPA